MQAATRRSIHSAFIRLRLQARCRQPALLLGGRSVHRASNGRGVSVCGGVAGRRWLVGTAGLREGKSTVGGEEEEGGARGGVEGVQEGGSELEDATAAGEAITATAAATLTSTLRSSSAAPASSPPPAVSPDPETATTSEPPAAATTTDTSPAQTTKPRGRPIGSSNTSKRRPPTAQRSKEKGNLTIAEIPAWFLRDGVMMVEDNLARPTNLGLWITPDRGNRSREEIREALEAYGGKLVEERGEGEGEGGHHPLVVEALEIEQLARDVTAEEGVGGVGGVDGGAVAAAAPPPLHQSPAASGPDPKGPAGENGSTAAAIEGADGTAKGDSTDGKPSDSDYSVTVGVNKLVQIDQTLQETFPGITPGQHLLSALTLLGSHVESHLEKVSNGRNRYAIHVFIWREIMAHVTAGLALPKASSNDSDVATKSHVLLKCPREGGLYFLDAVVEHAASLVRADVVRIDPQDLEEMAGDYLGDTKYFSLSNLTSQKIRTLGYDAQSQSHSMVPAREEDPEEEEEEEDEYIDAPPEPQPQTFFAPLPGSGGSPLRTAVVTLLPGGANAGSIVLPAPSTTAAQAIDSDRRNEKKLYKLLEAVIDSAATKRVQNNSPPVYQDPWHADPTAPHDISHVQQPQSSPQLPSSPDSPPPTPTPTNNPPQKTIIHIRDYSELLRTPQGAPIIRMIHSIVSQRRLSGHPILILGTTSTPETSYSLTRTNLEQAQELTPDANERTIIVPPAKSPAEDDLDEIMESDRRARIREVNIRHLRDIIRRRSGEGKAGIELMVPRDWHLEEEGGEVIEGIGEEMWSFDRAHRVATMAIGMYHKWFQSVRIPPQEMVRKQLGLTGRQQKEVGEFVAAALEEEGGTSTSSTPPTPPTSPTTPTPATTSPPPPPSSPEYTPGILTPQHISYATHALSQSDTFKYTWALHERRRLRATETPLDPTPPPLLDDDDLDLDPTNITSPNPSNTPPKPKSTSATLMKKLSKLCNSHEQKLLSGVINPNHLHTTFSCIRAPPSTIDALKTLTTLSLIRPEAFRYGVLSTDRIPGVLLYGPPGTGKTLLARAVAKESGATVLEVSGSDIFDMYVGEGEKNVRAMFTLAGKLSPCIIFLDEADAILGSRTSQGQRTTQREVVNQFLREWADIVPGAAMGRGTFLMVATNRPFDLDDAVLRRLPRRILVDLPTKTDRLEILKIHLRDEILAPDVDLPDIAARTQLYSGSDLKNLCVSAALTCVKHAQEEFVSKGTRFPEKRVLEWKHFEKALGEVGASVGEDMGSLTAMRKWDEKYGEGRRRGRGRVMGFGGVGGGKESGKGGGGVEEEWRVRRGVVY